MSQQHSSASVDSEALEAAITEAAIALATMDEDPTVEPLPLKRKRNRDVFDIQAWVDPATSKDVFTDAELDEALAQIAHDQWGYLPVHGKKLYWKFKRWENRKRTADRRRIAYCAFHNQSGCQYRVSIVQKRQDHNQVFLGLMPHADHEISFFKSQPPKQVVQIISSPGKAELAPTTLLRKGLVEKKLNLDTAMQKNATRLLAKESKRVLSGHLKNGGTGKSWGCLAETVNGYKRDSLETFDEHTTYLCDDQFYANSDEERLYCAFSTENLLLNAYRQLASGQDFFIAIDTSYRYTPEKTGLMPIKVVSINQVGHIIAYGVVSNEDEDAHSYILERVKNAVEDVVRRRVARGDHYA
jgi:hypothetical protein